MVKNLDLLPELINNIQGAIFDMDGTLIDLEDLNYRSYADVLKKSFSYDLDRTNYHKYFSGTKTASGFTNFIQSINQFDFNVDELIKSFRAQKRDNLLNNIENVVSLKPQAKEFLTSLKGKGVTLALATSTILEFTEIILSHFELMELFEFIVTAEDVKEGKPNPEIYNLCVKKMKLKKENLIVFEDSLNGINAAKNAGIKCIGIYDENWNHEFVEAADVIIENFSIA